MEKTPYSLGSSRSEQKRLLEQRKLYKDTIDIRFEPTDRVCEFGCGPLSNYWIPQAVPGGQYLGVDVQAAHIEEARQRAADIGLSNVDFVLSDGASTSLPSDFFDVGFSRCLLIHIPDPAPVLRELLRIVRPSGRIVLIEPHDPTYYVTPNKPNLLKAHRARDHFSYQNGRGYPDAALNLYTLLMQLGAANVGVKPHIIFATGAEPDRCRAFMQNWLGLIEPVISSLVSEGLLTQQEWEEARREAEEVSPETFLYQSMWIAEGTRR